MSNQREKIEELVSAYLDGELSAQESLEFQQLLDSDSSLQGLVSEFRQIRLALLAFPSNRLGESFADRVLSAAQDRVSSMDSPPSWIRPKVELADKTPLTMKVNARERVQAWVMVFSGLAAVLLIGFFANQWIQSYTSGLAKNNSATPKQGIAHVDPSTSSNDSDNKAANQDIAAKQDNIVKQNSASSEGNEEATPLTNDNTPPEKLKVESIAQGEAPATKPTIPEGTEAQPSKLAPSDIAMIEPGLESPESAKVSAQSIQPNSNQMADTVSTSGDAAIEEEREMMKRIEEMMLQGEVRFLFVVDVAVSREAWDSELLADILDRHDIPFESPVEVDADLRKELVRSRFVGPQDGQGELKEDIALVFVKARGERLDRAISEVYLATKPFPAFSLDLSFDPPAQEVLADLQNYREFGEFEVGTQPNQPMGVARSLTSSQTSQLFSKQFLGTDRRVPPTEDRSAWQSPPTVEQSMNPVEYALFILRPEGKE